MNKTELEKVIKEANMAYSAGIPFITDQEYDILWQALYAIDPDNSLLYHTAQAHNQVHGKSWHKYQIFGTNKAFNMEDLKPFLTRFGDQLLTIEPKYDGCAAVITQEQSGLKLTLEGDGQCGSDVTHLIPFINFPFKVRNFQAVEILLPVAEWNPNYGKNPRNVVAGWFARKYETPGAQMTAIPHNFGELFKDYQYDGNLETLGELLIQTHAEWAKIYPIDGLMIKVKDERSRIIAGNNGVKSNWSIAWKPPIQIKATTVTNIEWNVSRLGRVIPTVIYEPIDLCGTINSRVTGNNAKWLMDKKIVINSRITVGKAGEIIPKIIEVQAAGHDFTLIESCPTCGEILQWDGVHLVCNGSNCIAQKIVSIAYFYSLKGMKIDGIGEAMIEKLLNHSKCYSTLVERPWALLDMSSYDIMLDVIQVLGVATFNNIIEAINEASENRSIAHFVSGLGIQGLAYKSALKLCQYIKTGAPISNVPGRAIKSFPEAAMTFQKAAEEMKIFKFVPVPDAARIKYCITGTLSISREAMIEMLNDYSFGFSAAVTTDTNYLIIGEEAGKTKINKAIKYNVPQITEEQLMKIIKEK
jgi:NAD-dependent DNA ligase